MPLASDPLTFLSSLSGHMNIHFTHLWIEAVPPIKAFLVCGFTHLSSSFHYTGDPETLQDHVSRTHGTCRTGCSNMRPGIWTCICEARYIMVTQGQRAYRGQCGVSAMEVHHDQQASGPTEKRTWTRPHNPNGEDGRQEIRDCHAGRFDLHWLTFTARHVDPYSCRCHGQTAGILDSKPNCMVHTSRNSIHPEVHSDRRN